MTDGISAMRRDGEIARVERELPYRGAELLKKHAKPTRIAKKKVEDLTQRWIDYTMMGGGDIAYPSKGLARRHVLALNRWASGDLSHQNASQIVSNELQDSHYYIAVGGHGRIMGDTENIIRKALENKYGEIPHSFSATVDEKGNIGLEKLTCKDCPVSGACTMTNRCNGYDETAYNQAEQKRLEDKKEYEQIVSQLS